MFSNKQIYNVLLLSYPRISDRIYKSYSSPEQMSREKYDSVGRVAQRGYHPAVYFLWRLPMKTQKLGDISFPIFPQEFPVDHLMDTSVGAPCVAPASQYDIQ